MSNSLAIAAVTATLQRMLNNSTSGLTKNLPPSLPPSLNLNTVNVTTKPPDKARAASDNSNQVNIFLYQSVPNAALRNMDMPRQVSPGETAQPPVALSLHYLLSAYAQDDNDTASQILLGEAMRIFHDNAVLDQNDIKQALAGNDLYLQVERVRITLLPLSVEEISKLWTAFATNYRVSTAFEVSVVLIESTRPAKTPLPVLTRAKDDSGAQAQSDLVSPFPTLLSLAFASAQQPSAQLGQSLTLHGHHLNGDALAARFNHPRLPTPIDLALTAITTDSETDTAAALPDDAAARVTWAAGFYTVALVVSRQTDPANKIRTTNQLSFALAPHILTIAPKTSSAAAGDFTLTITCSPHVLPEQRASVLFGSAEILADPHLAATDTLTFRITPITPSSTGDYFVRLRVDGVDSLLVDYTQTPAKFDPNQKVTIT
jgi:hypothetical protein